MSHDSSVHDTGVQTSHDEELPREYRGYDNSHPADTLSDFGLDLSIDETEGILIPAYDLDHIPLRTERTDEFPVEYIIVRPVGVGPSQAGLCDDIDGTESVFVNLHPVRTYDIPGHYVRTEPHTTTAQFERSTVEQHVRDHTIVEPLNNYKPFHWQDPSTDPEETLTDPEN